MSTIYLCHILNIFCLSHLYLWILVYICYIFWSSTDCFIDTVILVFHYIKLDKFWVHAESRLPLPLSPLLPCHNLIHPECSCQKNLRFHMNTSTVRTWCAHMRLLHHIVGQLIEMAMSVRAYKLFFTKANNIFSWHLILNRIVIYLLSLFCCAFTERNRSCDFFSSFLIVAIYIVCLCFKNISSWTVEITVAAHDTTGGMATKISEAAMIARQGVDVYIVKVNRLLVFYQQIILHLSHKKSHFDLQRLNWILSVGGILLKG